MSPPLCAGATSQNSCLNVGSTWITRPSPGGWSHTARSWRKPFTAASGRCGSAGAWTSRTFQSRASGIISVAERLTKASAWYPWGIERRCTMDTIQLWARNGDAVRQAIELGALVHLDTASEELTDEFLLFVIQSGLLAKWADAFPDPRRDPEIRMEGILSSHLAARFAGVCSMRKARYVLRSASVLGALGYSVEVLEPEQGLSLRGTSDDKLISGDVLRKLLVKLENHVDLNVPLRLPSYEPSLAV